MVRAGDIPVSVGLVTIIPMTLNECSEYELSGRIYLSSCDNKYTDAQSNVFRNWSLVNAFARGS